MNEDGDIVILEVSKTRCDCIKDVVASVWKEYSHEE